MKALLIEALVVGLMVTLIGLVISYISMYVKSPEKTKDFEHWWSVAVSFWISGMLVHFICEFTGMNKWYCKNGNACVQ